MLTLDNSSGIIDFINSVQSILIIVPRGEDNCIVVHDEDIHTPLPCSSTAFIRNLCLLSGTTFEGAYLASLVLLSGGYKRPIYIGGRFDIILVPSKSPINEKCIWTSLYCLNRYSVERYNALHFEHVSLSIWAKRENDGKRLRNRIFEK